MSVVLTEDELTFTRYFCYEYVASFEAGPAGRWCADNGIHPSNMIPFQYAVQKCIEDMFEWFGNPAEFPPFKPAWKSREEFETRAREVIEIYPTLKDLPHAQPGFWPTKAKSEKTP